MADRLLCSRIQDDGRCNHPVTGQRHGEVVPDAMRSLCAASGCEWMIRRNPAESPEMEAICVDHIDDEAFWHDEPKGGT